MKKILTAIIITIVFLIFATAIFWMNSKDIENVNSNNNLDNDLNVDLNIINTDSNSDSNTDEIIALENVYSDVIKIKVNKKTKLYIHTLDYNNDAFSIVSPYIISLDLDENKDYKLQATLSETIPNIVLIFTDNDTKFEYVPLYNGASGLYEFKLLGEL